MLRDNAFALLHDAYDVARAEIGARRGRAMNALCLSEIKRAAAGAERKRLHDLPGVTATEKVAAVLDDPRFQREMGWRGETTVARQYVDTGQVLALRTKKRNDG